MKPIRPTLTNKDNATWEAALETWEADVKNYREACPGGDLCGAWLAEQRALNPAAYPGVEAEDAGDGLGPRLHGWEGPAPDLAAFAATVAARVTDSRDALASARTAISEAKTVEELRDAVLALEDLR